ncbi:MAG: hypothetical protein RBR74_05815 [Ignavibacteriaceae bacterium]|jgi:hypothetical protein|nr:hypothetical protein [Ignavibacteriaceae bacterium]
MKKILFVVISLFVFISCSKKEVPFEAFSPEAFAYDLGDSWEVNSQVMVKGFLQFEKDGIYTASLQYTIDLIKPNGEKVQSVFSDEKSETKNEPIMDVSLEAQFEIDSSYEEGTYELTYNITNEISKKTLSINIDFDLLR